MSENIDQITVDEEKFRNNLDTAVDLVILSAAGPENAECWYGVYPEDQSKRSHLASNAAMIGLTLRTNMNPVLGGEQAAANVRNTIKNLAVSELTLNNAERGYRSLEKRMMFLSVMSPAADLNEEEYSLICKPFAPVARILFQEIGDIALKLTISEDPAQLLLDMKNHSGESIYRTDLATGYYRSQPAVLHTDREQATLTFPRES